jgi:hypothetical protein
VELIAHSWFAAPIRRFLLVLAPKQEVRADEYGGHVGNMVFWDGTHAGLDQMRRMMPECNITCVKRSQADGMLRPASGLEMPILKIDYPGGEVEYAEAGEVDSQGRLKDLAGSGEAISKGLGSGLRRGAIRV